MLIKKLQSPNFGSPSGHQPSRSDSVTAFVYKTTPNLSDFYSVKKHCWKLLISSQRLLVLIQNPNALKCLWTLMHRYTKPDRTTIIITTILFGSYPLVILSHCHCQFLPWFLVSQCCQFLPWFLASHSQLALLLLQISIFQDHQVQLLEGKGCSITSTREKMGREQWLPWGFADQGRSLLLMVDVENGCRKTNRSCKQKRRIWRLRVQVVLLFLFLQPLTRLQPLSWSRTSLISFGKTLALSLSAQHLGILVFKLQRIKLQTLLNMWSRYQIFYLVYVHCNFWLLNAHSE